MTNQRSQKMYWKDALRQAQIEIVEDARPSVDGPPASAGVLSAAHNRKWAKAFRQAQADMEDPGAVVWLPEEIAHVIQQVHQNDEDHASPHTSRPRPKLPLTALLAGLAILLLPAVMNYFRAYRKISAHFSL